MHQSNRMVSVLQWLKYVISPTGKVMIYKLFHMDFVYYIDNVLSVEVQ